MRGVRRVLASSEQMKWLRKVIGAAVYFDDASLKNVATKSGTAYGTVYRVANKQVKNVQLATYTQMAEGLKRGFPRAFRSIGEPPGPFFEGYGVD